MILTSGKLNAEQLLAGNVTGKPITKIGVGTSDTAVTAADTALTGAIIKDITGVVYLPGNIVQFQSSLIPADPTIVIQEMGLYNEDDVLVHRKVIAPYNRSTGVTTSLAYNVKIV